MVTRKSLKAGISLNRAHYAPWTSRMGRLPSLVNRQNSGPEAPPCAWGHGYFQFLDGDKPLRDLQGFLRLREAEGPNTGRADEKSGEEIIVRVS